jgi:pimeloyl-ACP methyl ester carboxylesterase
MPSSEYVFLPGFMCDENLFAAQTAFLADRGVNSRVHELSSSASIDGLARKVLQKAPDQFALAGLSMGGIVALEIYRQQPRRVTHLALLNTTWRPDQSAGHRRTQLQRIAHGEFSAVMTEDLKPKYLAPINQTPERRRLIGAMAARLGPDVFARQTQALMTRDSAEAILPRITCPVLVLTGAQDTICPPALHREMAARIPRARLRILGDCGHLSPLEQPDVVCEHLMSLLNADRGPPWEDPPRDASGRTAAVGAARIWPKGREQ